MQHLRTSLLPDAEAMRCRHCREPLASELACLVDSDALPWIAYHATCIELVIGSPSDRIRSAADTVAKKLTANETNYSTARAEVDRLETAATQAVLDASRALAAVDAARQVAEAAKPTYTPSVTPKRRIER